MLSSLALARPDADAPLLLGLLPSLPWLDGGRSLPLLDFGLSFEPLDGLSLTLLLCGLALPDAGRSFELLCGRLLDRSPALLPGLSRTLPEALLACDLCAECPAEDDALLRGTFAACACVSGERSLFRVGCRSMLCLLCLACTCAAALLEDRCLLLCAACLPDGLSLMGPAGSRPFGTGLSACPGPSSARPLPVAAGWCTDWESDLAVVGL